MSFDFVYEEERRNAGISQEEVANARILVQSALGSDFFEIENGKANKMAVDIVTKNYLKHPLLNYIESPFLNNVCNLLHLAEALVTFKDASISEYLSRLRKQELFKATVFELMIGLYLSKRGLFVIPSYKIDGGEIDVYIPAQEGVSETFVECKTYLVKKNREELRRNLFGSLMNRLSELPDGFIICFKSYVEITPENLKSIKGRLISIMKNCAHLYEQGETKHDFDFGRLHILYFDEITEDITRAIRSEYNEFVTRTMVPQKEFKDNFKKYSDPNAVGSTGKYYANALAFDLPLPKIKESNKTNYYEKAKSDIEEKIKQHKSKLDSEKIVYLILENIPSEDFLLLKNEVDNNGLYSKYGSLNIIFVSKKSDLKSIDYELLPLKLMKGESTLFDYLLAHPI